MTLLTHRMATSKLYVSEDMLRRAEEDTFALCVLSRVSGRPADCDMHSAFARIENHYFVNEVCPGFFVYFRGTLTRCGQGFVRDGQLLEEQSIDKMSVELILSRLTFADKHLQSRHTCDCRTGEIRCRLSCVFSNAVTNSMF